MLLQRDVVNAYTDSKATCAPAEQHAVLLDPSTLFFAALLRLNRARPPVDSAVPIKSFSPGLKLVYHACMYDALPLEHLSIFKGVLMAKRHSVVPSPVPRRRSTKTSLSPG